ncbi:hypothetical protein ABK905_13075 [Acerihabitans sp. KWT182]|uniref:Uncharacterized protein n=1 Tax=Acerihabitans sp. KWT182 TaxID=3157919 RepID=A0AAU7QFQ5_9GAMM
MEQAVSRQTLQLAGTQRYLHVAALGGDTYRGNRLYVRIDPRTGEAQGVKYFLSADRQLLPVPVKAAVKLKNILLEGLGGKGSGKAARVWGTVKSIDDLALVTLPQYQNPQYLQIESYGSRDAESILFPEKGIALQQTALDPAAYAVAFARLPDFQKRAIRSWTLVDGDSAVPSARWGDEPINIEINHHLYEREPLHAWETRERLVLSGLMAAFDSPLPRQSGSFLRVAEYQRDQIIPWGDTIGPGDIVTNFPTLMSASAEDHYARIYTELTAKEAEENNCKALIYYEIKGGSCLPLARTQADAVLAEYIYLFRPLSFFRVKAISHGLLIGGEMYPSTRIGVVLEEIEQPIASAKNLFTGEVIHFN